EVRRTSSFPHASCSATRCCPSTPTRTTITPLTTGPTRPLLTCAKCILLHLSSHSSSTSHTTPCTRHCRRSPRISASTVAATTLAGPCYAKRVTSVSSNWGSFPPPKNPLPLIP